MTENILDDDEVRKALELNQLAEMHAQILAKLSEWRKEDEVFQRKTLNYLRILYCKKKKREGFHD